MAERQEDQSRSIDQALSLFENAMAETETVLPRAQFGSAIAPKELPPSELREKKQAASFLGRAVSFVRTVAGVEPLAVQTALPLLQPPVTKQAPEKAIEEAWSHPLADQAPSIGAIVPVGEPNAAESASPAVNEAEAAVSSSRQSADKPASKDVLPLERPTREKPPSPIDRALSLVKDVVISEHKAVPVKKVAASESWAVQTASASLQLPVDKPASKDVRPLERAAREQPPSPIDQALSLVKDIVISERKTVLVTKVAISEPGAVRTASASSQLPVERPASTEVRPLERAARKEPPSLIDHALSLVKDVVISERKTVLVTQVAISEPGVAQAVSPSLQPPAAKPAPEKPDRDARPDPLIDQAPSMVAIVPIDEPNVAEAASPTLPDAAEAEVLSLRQPVDKPARKDLVLPLLQRLIEEKPSSPIEGAHSAVVEAGPAEAAVPLPQQPLMEPQSSPNAQLDMDLADIRRRVAIFKDNQQRFRREREEREAMTGAKAGGLSSAASDRASDT
ncbi:MAG: hypothetical protein ACXWKP_03875 [Bradyrhizobium sp.]